MAERPAPLYSTNTSLTDTARRNNNWNEANYWEKQRKKQAAAERATGQSLKKLRPNAGIGGLARAVKHPYETALDQMSRSPR